MNGLKLHIRYHLIKENKKGKRPKKKQPKHKIFSSISKRHRFTNEICNYKLSLIKVLPLFYYYSFSYRTKKIVANG